MKKDRYNMKTEYVPRYNSTFTVYYDQRREEPGPSDTSRTLYPSAWWEERWAPWIFTKTTLSYRREEHCFGAIRSSESSVTPQLNTTLRMREAAGEADLTADVSATRQESGETMYGSTFQIDLRPRGFLRLKTKLDMSYDESLTSTVLVTLSAQF
jgi:hypothetical protein